MTKEQAKKDLKRLFDEMFSTADKSIQHEKRRTIASLLQSLDKGKLNDDMAYIITDISKTISDHIETNSLDNLDNSLKLRIEAVLLAAYPNQ